tara:strand:- start:5285 stop:6232 length:948 start_codon:yes stop_codon:yes gene_type:complete
MIKYSVIIPTVTIGNRFITALDRIVKQDYKNKFEIIVIIDNTSIPIAQGINNLFRKDVKSKFIRIIQNKKNIGLTKSLNKAIMSAKGKFIIRNDEDDFSAINRITTIDRIIKNNKNVKFISSNYILNNGLFLKKRKLNISIRNISKILKFKNPIAHSTTCFEAKLFKKLGGYNETLKVSQDFELWSKFIYDDSNHYYHIRDYLVEISIRHNSISKIYSDSQKANSTLIALKNNFRTKLYYDDYGNFSRLSEYFKNIDSKNLTPIQNKFNALLFCYLPNKKNKSYKFNIKVLINICHIYYYYPNLFVKMLFGKLYT